ncbi:helix-turn-helix transcriptional regulator [Piscinibacter sp. Jin2]|uniref:Helix-turn-helix transcriptional regulator n=1 Tax=Aquariibacter lacus TaxID=2801332 RepID=A0A9X1BQ77_9BURK|nr:metalloregulator ArsR/SmtB family transcription factor [Piscinibacter lacus]MBL0718293.1 helix-turn-helix transcriptional regulator [Piscinibacter lacus]
MVSSPATLPRSESPPHSAERLGSQSEAAAALLRALAHPGRLQLLCALVDRECCVSELAETTGLTQPSLSQQLGVLRGEGLVETRRDGRHIHYAIASDAARAVIAALHAHFCPTNRPARPHAP